MFRISRVRIRWIDPDQRGSAAALASGPVSAAGAARRDPRRLAPWNWRVRMRWVGFGPLPHAESKAFSRVIESQQGTAARPVRLLRTFDLPKIRVRVSWAGWGSPRLARIGVLALLAACLWLGLFAVTRPVNDAAPALSMERIDSAGLDFLEVNLGGQMLRMTYSRLDIGQPQDIFDNNLDTLMRGREDNPFILDFEFAEPQPITGLTMDFGRMDFILRVQVYGTEDPKPIPYEGEFRQQPDIPHAEMNFLSGPEQVGRIYIEIEQLNPPDEVHIHVREVVLKQELAQEP